MPAPPPARTASPPLTATGASPAVRGTAIYNEGTGHYNLIVFINCFVTEISRNLGQNCKGGVRGMVGVGRGLVFAGGS